MRTQRTYDAFRIGKGLGFFPLGHGRPALPATRPHRAPDLIAPNQRRELAFGVDENSALIVQWRSR
jgi:hypothetical protein